jgi:hypothetical protein
MGTAPLPLQIALQLLLVTVGLLLGMKKPQTLKFPPGGCPGHTLPFAHIEELAEIH